MEAISRKTTIVQNEPEVLASVINDAHIPDTQASMDDNSSIQSYAPDIDDKDNISNSIDSNSYQGSPLQIVKTRFFSKRIVDSRKQIMKSFLLTNFLYSIVIYPILLMFWGSNAYTTKYYHKVKLLAVLQDDYIPDNNLGLSSLTDSLGSMIEQSPGQWSIFNTSSFEKRYDLTGGTEQINEKVIERIYHEHYWIAINVKPNITMSLYDSLLSGNNTTDTFNSTDLFEVIYESGREPTNMASGFLPIVETIEAEFKLFFATQYIPSLMKNLTSTNNLNFENLGSILQMNFYYNDYKPFYRRALISPIQVGLIFAIILSIFHFMLYSQINTYMAKILKPRDYIFYRIGLTWFTFFFISLFYCSVSAVFKIDFTKAFGRGGFVVYWMTTWLFMLACGGANENVLSLIFLYGPQFLGFWILFFIIVNASTTFFPFALNSVFYRIGYMLPMHNAADIYRVIFFDLTRIKMGRNYGVLIAWIVLNTLLAPIIMWHVGETVQKRAQAAASKAAQEAEK